MDKIRTLATILDHYNSFGEQISQITQRPATRGHTGEFIASQIFDIELEESANQKAIDGRFRSGPLSGKSVNIKWYGKQESMLDISESDQPDYYLVLAGPKSQPVSTKGAIRPWVIEYVYLFDSEKLTREQQARNVKLGVASSVRKQQWLEAQIYPDQGGGILRLSPKQQEQLDLFRSK